MACSLVEKFKNRKCSNRFRVDSRSTKHLTLYSTVSSTLLDRFIYLLNLNKNNKRLRKVYDREKSIFEIFETLV